MGHRPAESVAAFAVHLLEAGTDVRTIESGTRRDRRWVVVTSENRTTGDYRQGEPDLVGERVELDTLPRRSRLG